MNKKLIIAILLLGSFNVAFARTRKPAPVVPQTVTVSTLSLQWGVYAGDSPASFTSFEKSVGKSDGWEMAFTDGAFPSGLTGNLEIFIEPNYTDAQIIAGQFDSQLKAFATAAAKYPYQIRLPLNEEVNCDNTDKWGGSYRGNTPASAITAYQHEYKVIKAIAPKVLFGYSVNNDSCSGGASITSYYPGASYVDFIAVDGFDFGGQTWDGVFDHAIVPLQAYGKPIWIGAEGSVDNKSKFIADTYAGAKHYGIAGFLYFDVNEGGGNWTLDSAGLAEFKALAR